MLDGIPGVHMVGPAVVLFVASAVAAAMLGWQLADASRLDPMLHRAAVVSRR